MPKLAVTYPSDTFHTLNISTSDLWEVYEHATVDLVVVTTNSYVTKAEELVMGKGAALQAASKFPWLPLQAGRKIKHTCGHLGFYGFYDFGNIGLFQVKRHYYDNADLQLLRQSCFRLANYMFKVKNMYGKMLNVHMNFPAIGNGRLPLKEVAPILAHILPSTVTLHARKEDLENADK